MKTLKGVEDLAACPLFHYRARSARYLRWGGSGHEKPGTGVRHKPTPGLAVFSEAFTQLSARQIISHSALFSTAQ